MAHLGASGVRCRRLQGTTRSRPRAKCGAATRSRIASSCCSADPAGCPAAAAAASSNSAASTASATHAVAASVQTAAQSAGTKPLQVIHNRM